MRIYVAVAAGLAAGTISLGAEAAKWKQFEIDRDEGGKVHSVVYVDTERLVRTGDIVKLSLLTEFKKPFVSMADIGKKGAWKSLSWIQDMEFDCRKRLQRTLRVAHFSGSMGQGTARYDKDAVPGFNTKWVTVVDEVDESDLRRWKKVCSIPPKRK